MDDPDAPGGLWVHWVVFDLPGTVSGLEGGVPRTATLANGGRQGSNTWGRLGWNGPAPPPGKPHRYVFRLFALSAPLGLQAGADAHGVKAAMKGKVLAETTLAASYGR
jgi:Raf kinase inhibitor-like YbhB/YbcL family protein